MAYFPFLTRLAGRTTSTSIAQFQSFVLLELLELRNNLLDLPAQNTCKLQFGSNSKDILESFFWYSTFAGSFAEP